MGKSSISDSMPDQIRNPIEEIVVHLNPSPSGAEILRLYKLAGWWRGDADPEEAVEIAEKSFLFAGAFAGEKLIGMARVISDGISDAYIQDVIVDPAFRKKGVGRRLVLALVEELKKKGIDWIGLVAEPGTDPFYESMGFRLQKGYHLMLFGERESI